MERSKIVKIASWAGGVVLLAAVIIGVAWFSAPKSTVPDLPVITTPSGGAGSAALASANSSGSAGAGSGTSSAGSGSATGSADGGGAGSGALGSMSDPSGSGGAGSGSNSSGSGGGEGAGTIKFGPIASMLPASVAGFTMGRALVNATEAQVTLEPATSDTAAKVTRVTLYVHDRGDATGATRFITSVSKRVYAEDAAPFVIGSSEAYFGTDGEHGATAAYALGRYAYEVIIAAREDAPPAGAQPIAKSLAAVFRPTGR